MRVAILLGVGNRRILVLRAWVDQRMLTCSLCTQRMDNWHFQFLADHMMWNNLSYINSWQFTIILMLTASHFVSQPLDMQFWVKHKSRNKVESDCCKPWITCVNGLSREKKRYCTHRRKWKAADRGCHKLFHSCFSSVHENRHCTVIRNLKSGKFVLVEFGILGFGIRNPVQWIRNPTNDGIRNPRFTGRQSGIQ